MSGVAARRALVLTNNLDAFTGSEIVSLEVAEALGELGFIVDLRCNYLSSHFKSYETKNISISESNSFQSLNKYDFIWAQHNLLALCNFEEDGAIRKEQAIVSAHLSPYEPLEFTGVLRAAALGAVFAANSGETKQALESSGLEGNRILNFKNACPKKFINEPDTISKFKTLLVVSNHPPEEVLDAVKILRRRGIAVSFVGFGGKRKRIEPDDIESCDAILAIGKTVQYAICGGRPVYCYDRFGGPGWLSLDNISDAEFYNYSGRCCNRKRGAEEIAIEIFAGFEHAQAQAREIGAIKTQDYCLESFLLQAMSVRLGEPFGAIKDLMAVAERSSRSNAEVTARLYRMYKQENLRRKEGWRHGFRKFIGSNQ